MNQVSSILLLVKGSKGELKYNMEKIKLVVRECDGNKCPGPDGCNFNFRKACWEVINGDIVKAVKEFHFMVSCQSCGWPMKLYRTPKREKDHVLSSKLTLRKHTILSYGPFSIICFIVLVFALSGFTGFGVV